MLMYGLPSTGASLYLHYCCGKLDTVSFSVQHKDGCMQKSSVSKTCCNNVAIDLKLDTDQQPFAAWVSYLPTVTAPIAILQDWQLTTPAVEAVKCHWSTGPPIIKATIPVYLKNCVFRI